MIFRKKIFLYGLTIELGMSLISAFPVDTITFMFFMDINTDASSSLLVLVKKENQEARLSHYYHGSIRLCFSNSISAMKKI